MSKQGVIENLTKALLRGDGMDHSLYESELELYVEDWYESLEADQDEFGFAILEDSGRVAMVLVMRDETVYINEEAREKLEGIWPLVYEKNMKIMIPMMADVLAEGVIFFTGIKTI